MAIVEDVDGGKGVLLFLVGQANVVGLLELLARLLDFPLVYQAPGKTLGNVGSQRMVGLDRLVAGEDPLGRDEAVVFVLAGVRGRVCRDGPAGGKRADVKEHGQVAGGQGFV